jgi:hypothetical protein
MPTFRMFPALTVGQQVLTANGRGYSGAPGAAIDVPDFDAGVLAANGWTRVALSGPTSARPTTNPNTSPPYVAARSLPYLDTTLGKIVVFDGATWRDPVNGNAV